MTKRSRWRRVWSWSRWPLLLLGLFLVFAVADAWRGMGQAARGARRERMERSPHWRDGGFVNPEPLVNDVWSMFAGMLEVSPHASPHGAIPVAQIDPRRLQTPPATGLRVTWLGHSSNLIELDGYRVLTDPSFSERSSPVSWAGPKRWFAPPIELEKLPPIHAVLISHDHYDHLDHATISAMRDMSTTFIVPLGVGQHLAYWGIQQARIIELDWWEHKMVGNLKVVCTPARHASGRTPFDKDQTLWASYALIGAQHRVYFSGDTGLFSAMGEIGAKLGPFDVTLIEVGQYHSAWPDWHIGPEQAVLAHRVLRGRTLLPVHWGRLQLAYHGWTEPIERVLAAAQSQGVNVVTPRPGELVELGSLDDIPVAQRWWPKLPWQTEQQHPIVSGHVSRAGWTLQP